MKIWFLASIASILSAIALLLLGKATLFLYYCYLNARYMRRWYKNIEKRPDKAQLFYGLYEMLKRPN